MAQIEYNSNIPGRRIDRLLGYVQENAFRIEENLNYTDVVKKTLDISEVSQTLTYTTVAVYYSISSGTWKSSSSYNASNISPISKGIVTIKAREDQDAYVALLNSQDLTAGTAPDFIAEYPAMVNIKASEEKSIRVPYDCFLYVYNAIDASTIVFPKSIEAVAINRTEIDNIHEDLDSLNNKSGNNSGRIDIVEEVIRMTDVEQKLNYSYKAVYYSNADKVWKAAAQFNASLTAPISKGKLYVKASDTSAAYFALLKTDELTVETAPEFIDEYPYIISIPQSSDTEIVVPYDCFLYLWNKSDGSTFVVPEIVISKIVGSEINEDITNINNSLNAIETAIDLQEVNQNLTFVDKAVYHHSTDNVWKTSLQSDASKVAFINKGNLTVIAKDDSKAYIALLKNVNLEVGTSPQFITEYPEFIILDAGTSITISIPYDCYLYVWNRLDYSTYVYPKSIIAKTYKSTTSSVSNLKTVKRYEVNLVDENTISTGSLDSSGNIVDGTGVVTDYINITCLDKTQFLKVCCFGENWGYNANKVVVYDFDKNILKSIENINTFIDKESDENSEAFINAVYIRVEFPEGARCLYVSNSNNRKVPEYSKYDINSIDETTSFIADQIRNNDGAITNMLRAALTYVNRGEITNLGYGDSNTAFDQKVEAVICDDWNPGYYEGLKKQINCSGFVQLALQGVTYENSRYVTGTEGSNLVTNFRFDSKVEENYHNAYTDADESENPAKHSIKCSDYQKLYANKLAKYANDRGFLYVIQDGLRNVEVGDLIFNSSSSSGFFLGIVHTLIVTAVYPKEDGTKLIEIMEVSGNSPTSLAHTAMYDSRRSTWIYGARYPYPNIAESFENIAKNVNAVSLNTLAAGTTELLADVETSENIKDMNVYTIIGDTNYVDGAEVYVVINEKIWGEKGDSLLIRRDGKFIKHFNIPYGSNIDTQNISIRVYARKDINQEITLKDIKVYNGYRTY